MLRVCQLPIPPGIGRVLFVSASLAACSGGAPSANRADAAAPVSPARRTAQFRADPPIGVGEEAYVCYSLEVDGIDGPHLGGVTWHAATGPVVVHHASLFGAAGTPALGEVSCDPMPERVAALGVYTPGARPLELPAGVGIALPPGTSRLVVLAHVLRVAEGPANATSVDLEVAKEPVTQLINWVDVFAPVPVVYPHEPANSVAKCRFDLPVHVVTVWPHMHRFGAEFHGVVIRKDGTHQPLLDLPSWDFNHQLTYPVDVDIESGDWVETQCYWRNPTDLPVLAGPYSTDEMCNQGLFVWPFDHAICTP
jgi:hypothetical protein